VSVLDCGLVFRASRRLIVNKTAVCQAVGGVGSWPEGEMIVRPDVVSLPQQIFCSFDGTAILIRALGLVGASL
jgi:hypothetical protein